MRKIRLALFMFIIFINFLNLGEQNVTAWQNNRDSNQDSNRQNRGSNEAKKSGPGEIAIKEGAGNITEVMNAENMDEFDRDISKTEERIKYALKNV